MPGQPDGDVFHYLVLIQLADCYQFPFTGCTFLNGNSAFIYAQNAAEVLNQFLIGFTSYGRLGNPYVQDSFFEACYLIPACTGLDLNNQLRLFFLHYSVIYSITLLNTIHYVELYFGYLHCCIMMIQSGKIVFGWCGSDSGLMVLPAGRDIKENRQ
jgi:hypothetical protein